jgi:hypothetical protein
MSVLNFDNCVCTTFIRYIQYYIYKVLLGFVIWYIQLSLYQNKIKLFQKYDKSNHVEVLWLSFFQNKSHKDYQRLGGIIKQKESGSSVNTVVSEQL